MSSVVAELEAGLQGMLALKPPGVSGSRIANITTLCVANVQVRSDNTTLENDDLEIFEALKLTVVSVAVRVGPHPETFYTLQENTRNTQIRSTLRRRLCNPKVDGAGQGPWTTYNPRCSRWDIRCRCE